MITELDKLKKIKNLAFTCTYIKPRNKFFFLITIKILFFQNFTLASLGHVQPVNSIYTIHFVHVTRKKKNIANFLLSKHSWLLQFICFFKYRRKNCQKLNVFGKISLFSPTPLKELFATARSMNGQFPLLIYNTKIGSKSNALRSCLISLY